jgi:two-component system nitrate/nitrite response regulator NarL
MSTTPLKQDSLEFEGIPTIVIVQNSLYRAGICCLLSQTTCKVLAQGSEVSTIDRGAFEIPDHCPTAIIIGSSGILPNSINQLEKARNLFPNGRLLVIADHPNRIHMTNCLRHGAHGYILADSTAEVLIESIRLLSLGQCIFPNEFVKWSNRNKTNDGFGSENIGNAYIEVTDLSEGECRVLGMIVAGMSNKQIGLEIDASEMAVKVRVKRILTKIDVSNRVQAAVWAVNNGLTAFNSVDE